MYPLVEASGGQEQYYIRSPWHWVILWVRLTFHQTYPPVVASSGQGWYDNIGIEECNWAGVFWRMQLRRQLIVRCTTLLQASGGQEQYYIRLALHLLICCSPRTEVSHTLQCRRYEFLKIEQFMYIDLFVFVVVFVTVEFCCCWSSVIVDAQLQIKNNNKIQQ